MEKANCLLEKLRRFEVEFKLEKQQVKEKYFGHHPTQPNEFLLNEWSSQVMVTVKLVLSQVLVYFADDNEAVNGYAHEVVRMLISNLVSNPEENLSKNLEMITSDQTQNQDMSNATTVSNEQSNLNLTNLVVKEEDHVNHNIQHQIDETNNNGEMIEQEDGDGEMNVNAMEQLAANQTGGDESRRMENAPMDTTPKRKLRVPQARNRMTNRDNQAVEGDEETDQYDEVSSRHVKRPRIDPTQPNHAQPNHRFQCQHCPKSFDHKANFLRHVQVHTGERPFRCDQCGQRFNLKGNLARHQLTHQNIRNFQCPECDKQFTQKSSLDAHLRIHSGERPFACRHCEMSFAQSNARDDHEQAIHLHVKSYRCKQCGHTATERSNIIVHIRMVHFGLPRTIKEQHELNIVDDRDPRELLEKV